MSSLSIYTSYVMGKRTSCLCLSLLLKRSLPCEIKCSLPVDGSACAVPILVLGAAQSMLAPVTRLLTNKNDPAPPGARLHPPARCGVSLGREQAAGWEGCSRSLRG